MLSNVEGLLTCGLSETYLAQCLMRRMASMLVSGKEALQANSDRHLTASWKESMVAAKCFSNTFAEEMGRRQWRVGVETTELVIIQQVKMLIFLDSAGLCWTYWRCDLWSERPAPRCSRPDLKQPSGRRRRCSSSLSGCLPPGSWPSERCSVRPCLWWWGTFRRKQKKTPDINKDVE